MERVAFLVEATGERVGALLNPDSLVVSRHAGVQPRWTAGGHLAGAGLPDDPLLYTGGGRTDLELHLLFDVDLTGGGSVTDDVRELTAPLWRLAENTAAEPYGRPPLVRFVWGKSWNVRAVVSAIAERLERFGPEGAARRSWLSLRLARIAEDPGTPASQLPVASPEAQLAASQAPAGVPSVHQIVGAGGEGGVGETLYDVANQYFGNPGLWRVIAAFNGIADPLRVPPGTVLRIPPVAVGQVQP
jgi:hypothetical protein